MWSALLPPSCGACGRPGPAPCPDCWSQLTPGPPLLGVPGVDRCRALLRYEGTGRDLLTQLKYRNRRDSLGWLAAGMAGLAAADRFDVVTWAPTTELRRRRRGFDQAEVLARAVGRRLGVPTRHLLSREPGPPQTGRDRLERSCGPLFVARARIVGRRVLLVDDVVTTGATLAAAAHALRQAGAAGVDAVTAAATPLKVVGSPADA
ncbi:MAG: ComF family protein [Actinobacteria bacterium]|nr:ComF family protein [Actinomycetota bacterium]